MKTQKPEIGSISTGTLLTSDLIPCFADEVERLGGKLPDGLRERMDQDDYYESEECDFDIEELDATLNELAPDYMYFGSVEGDGADFGFWISWDSIEMAVHDGEIDQGEDTPDWPHSKPFLHVNDHGNCTLYAADGSEIWSVC